MTARTLRLSAPGKLLLGGEYAVLAGAPAIVLAVGARLRLRSALGGDRSPRDADRSPGSGALPPEVVLTRQRAEARLGPVAMTMTLDRGELQHEGRKLGLGSSAAAAACAAAAVHAAHGRDPSDPAVRAELLQDALAGHRAVSPRGSGVDVAASVLGGLLRFERLGPEADQVYAEPLPWPRGLRLRVLWTGQAARTSDLIGRVEALAERDPAAHARCMDRLARQAERLAGAFARGEAGAVVEAARGYHEAMAGLGRAAAAPIVEARLQAAAELAARFGGAAKPSGAGGGDVAVAFFEREPDARRFEEAARQAGLRPLALRPDPEGVRLEEAS